MAERIEIVRAASCGGGRYRPGQKLEVDLEIPRDVAEALLALGNARRVAAERKARKAVKGGDDAA